MIESNIKISCVIILYFCVFIINTAFGESLPPKDAQLLQITIGVTGVEESGLYRTAVTPRIQLSDREANFETLLNKQPYDSGEISSEGNHLLEISTVDAKGNRYQKSISFIIDKTPPVTTPVINPPKYSSSKSLFLSNSSTIELLSQDSGNGISGVSKTEYHFGNASEWRVYKEPIDLNFLKNGVQFFYFRSIDNAGNIETTKTSSFILDSTQPKSKIEIGSPLYKDKEENSYVSGETSFTITAVDDESGVSQIEYRIDESAWVVYREPFKISDEGKHKISFRSTDNIGNVESIQNIIIFNDSTPPITTLALDDKKMDSSEIYYINHPVKISPAATDRFSGVRLSEYRIDQGNWQTKSPFILDDSKNHLISYRSSDNLNNQEITKTISVHIDKTAPVTTINVAAQNPDQTKGVLTVNDITFFTLSATDTQSGVLLTEYRIDNGEWLAYEPFTIQQGGKHSIEFRSTDKAGNIESPKSLTVFIDTFPPVSVISINNKTLEPGETFVSKDPVKVTISSTDKNTLIKQTEYKLDDKNWTEYQPFTIANEGIHLIEFRTTDKLDNIESTKFVKIVIDNTPPVTHLIIGEPKKEEQGQIQISDRTVLSLSAVDDLSGAYSSEYRIIGRGERFGSEPFNIATPGEYEIRYWSTDRAGNRESEKVSMVKVLIPPTPPPTVSAKPELKMLQTEKQNRQSASDQQTLDTDIPESIRMPTEPPPPLDISVQTENSKQLTSKPTNTDDMNNYISDFIPGRDQEPFGVETDTTNHTKEYLGIGGINALIITIIFLIL